MKLCILSLNEVIGTIDDCLHEHFKQYLGCGYTLMLLRNFMSMILILRWLYCFAIINIIKIS